MGSGQDSQPPQRLDLAGIQLVEVEAGGDEIPVPVAAVPRHPVGAPLLRAIDQPDDLLPDQVEDRERDPAVGVQMVGEDRGADAGGERIREVLLEPDPRTGLGLGRNRGRDREKRQDERDARGAESVPDGPPKGSA